MDINKAMVAHKDWIRKFRTAIEEKQDMDAETICLDDRCELGKWLHGDAKAAHKGTDYYDECVKAHAHFHLQAAEVARTINRKDFAAAIGHLQSGTAYSRATSDVLLSLVRFKVRTERTG